MMHHPTTDLLQIDQSIGQDYTANAVSLSAATKFSFNYLNYKNAYLTKRSLQPGTVILAKPSSEIINIIIPLNDNITANGIRLEPGSAYLWNGRYSAVFSTTGYFQCLDLSIQKQLIRRKTHQDFDELPFYRLSSDDYNAIVRLMANLNFDGELSTEALCRSVDSLNVSNEDTSFFKQAQLNLSSTVNRIDELLSEEGLNIHIEKLADATFTTRKTLERLFRNCFGLTPNEYLTLRRFSLLRQDLLTTEHPIGYLIHSLGIQNSGRFSQNYAKYYGETPRETRKCREFL